MNIMKAKLKAQRNRRENAMKKAKVIIVSVDVRCPYCDGDVPDTDSGSLYIDIIQHAPSDIFTCQDCGKQFQLEAKAWK